MLAFQQKAGWKHLEAIMNCVGDSITSIGNCHDIAKSINKDFHLNFSEGFSILVKPGSDVQDLITIWSLNWELNKYKKDGKKKILIFN